MNDGQEYASCKHEGCALTVFVVDASEEWGEEDSAEWEHGRDETCKFLINAVLEHHELGGKLQEWEYSCIEHKAEEGDAPEAGIEEEDFEVGELEAFF